MTSSTSDEIECSSPEKKREIEEKGDTTEEDIMAVTYNYEMVSAEHTILLPLDVEVAKIREDVKSLKKKLEELQEREENAESVLRELKDGLHRK